DGTWRLASRDGYPAQASHVDTFLQRVADLRTAYVSEQEQQLRYEEYGVAEPDLSASRAVKVTLRNNADDTLERVIVGHTFSAPGGTQLKKVFIRREGDPRVWLADSDLQVDSDPLAWLDRHIVDVPHGRVTELVTIAPRGERLAIRRSNDGDLRVAEGLPPGEDVRGPWVLNRMASALEGLKFDDVRSAGSLPEGESDAWQSMVRTADGLTFHIRLLPRAEEYWAVFSAEAGAQGRPPDGAATPAPGGGADAPPEAAEQAERFNARHSGWAYQMPPYSAERLTTRARDLTE
ncbi:MAG: DUF4340 domain-containing protein, partial [Chloroflexota bacterium]